MSDGPMGYLALDCDGVICVRPWWARMVPVRSPGKDAAKNPASQLLMPEWANQQFQRLRFARRAPIAGVSSALQRIGESHQLVLVTGRATSVQPQLESWLGKHDLGRFFSAVYCRGRSTMEWAHKLAVARELEVIGFVEDNPHVALYLAHHDVKVFLLGTEASHPNIEVVEDLSQLHHRLRHSKLFTPAVS